MKCSEIIKILEEQFPPSSALSWDNVGLLAGCKEKEVKKIYIALDATSSVIEDAGAKGADMLLTHHPLLFSPIKKVSGDDVIGKRVISLIQKDISYYALHTNYDIHGMAELSGKIMELKNSEVFSVTDEEKIFKIAVFVPEEYAENVFKAMTDAGAGSIGNYAKCTYQSEGTGTFLPLEGTNPFIGTNGKLEKVKEIKIESAVSASKLYEVIKDMKKAHPYEEPAYDIYEMKINGEKCGIGRVGELPRQMSLKECAEYVKEKFCLESVRIFGNPDTLIKRAAISPGSGKGMYPHAVKQGAQVLITGDIDHHEGIDAVEDGVCVIDAGHYGLEYIFVAHLKQILEQKTENIELVEERQNPPFIVL